MTLVLEENCNYICFLALCCPYIVLYLPPICTQYYGVEVFYFCVSSDSQVRENANQYRRAPDHLPYLQRDVYDLPVSDQRLGRVSRYYLQQDYPKQHQHGHYQVEEQCPLDSQLNLVSKKSEKFKSHESQVRNLVMRCSIEGNTATSVGANALMQ